MEASTTNTLLSDHIIKALCNTLMHSLWQGIVLALLTGAIIIFTKKASAAYRYNLLIGAMVLFAFGVTVTFIWQLQNPAENSAAYISYTGDANTANTQTASSYTSGIHTNPAAPISEKAAGPIVQQTGTGNITETVINYFNTHYNIIVLIWFLIICAKSVQMAVGLHSVYHLKQTKVFKVSNEWENRLSQIAEQLRIKQTIRLLESGIAKVPMVIGHLKPVILIPIGLINSLSTDEVEAILIHELAHIRRRDYLVNLLQSFMEIVFFFNPAVLWISQLIKTERENCCDDLAIAQSRNKENYIRALLSCEEYKAAGPNYAMAFPGSKNTLLDRVKRMVGNGNHSLNMFEKTILTVCLVVLGLGVSAFTAREDIKKAVNKVVAAIHHDVKAGREDGAKTVKNDMIVKNQPNVVNVAAAVLVPLQKSALLVTDTSKLASAIALKELIDKIDSSRGHNVPVQSLLAAVAKLDTNNFKKFHAIGLELYRERVVTDTTHLSISLNDRELIVNGVRMPEDVFERISRQFGAGARYGSGYAQPYGKNYTGLYDAKLQERSKEIARELIKENLVNDKSNFTYKLSRDEFSIDGIKQPDELRSRIVDEFFKPDDNFNIGYTSRDPGVHDTEKRYWAGQERKIIDEMQREGLIENRKNLSFTLTNKTFVINGLVQNGEVFERYRQEYVPASASDNWDWNYPSYPGNYSANAYRPRDWDAYGRQTAAERKRKQDEMDKNLVADLLQDGLITDPNNVTFKLDNKGATINGKKESDAIYQKYKEKYEPNSTGDWSWTYQHHQ